MWVNKDKKFYNKSMKSWLRNNYIELYSTYNEGKSVAVERFIRNLKNKIPKYMASISKNIYIDKLDNIVSKYNNAYHRAIKIRPVHGKSSTYIDFNKEIIKEDAKIKVGEHVRIPKYKNIFAKDYVSNWSKEIFVIKKT